MRLLIFFLILGLCAPAFADQKVYKTVGPNGEVSFSDTPSKGAKEMVVPPAPTYQSPPIPASATPSRRSTSSRPQGATDSYQQVRIVAPSNGGTVVNTSGTVRVTVLVQPPLKVGRGDKIQLLLDGKVATEAATPNLKLKNVDRGTHQLEARIVRASGTTLKASRAITFYVHRPSIHLPGRRKSAPPHP